MNLSEQFENACALVDTLLSERQQLLEAKIKADEVATQANKALVDNDAAIRVAVRGRDETSAALSIAPELSPNHIEELKINRQKVFAQMRLMPDVFVKPELISIMTGIESNEVSSILRRASKIEGFPLKHNGDRGRGSQYMWVSKKQE